MASYAFFSQLPASPIVTTKQQARSSTTTTAAPRWRLREAAQALWDDRTEWVQKDGVLLMSTDFDVSVEVLQEHVNDQVTGRAFTLAARSVLHAMRQAKKEGNDSDDDDANTNGGSHGHYAYDSIPNLPVVLQVRQAIRKARAAALQRSLDNKEWAKRKVKPTTAAPLKSLSSKGGPKATKEKKRKNAATASTATAEATTSNGGTPATTAAATTSNADTAAPKFTRNTPASSAAALDQRFTNSRAILCAAGNIVLKGASSVSDPADIPQKDRLTNLGAVVVDATVYGRRTLCLAENAARRAAWRYQFRQAHYKAQRVLLLRNDDDDDEAPLANLRLPNLFLGSKRREWLLNKDDEMMGETWDYQPHLGALTEAWESEGRATLTKILETDGRACLYYDTEWNSRHGRLGDFLRSQARENENDDSVSSLTWGPHLILTTQPEVD